MGQLYGESNNKQREETTRYMREPFSNLGHVVNILQ